VGCVDCVGSKVIGWRAWFDDNAVFEGTEGFDSLPEDGVLVIMLYHKDGTKRILIGSDYYFSAKHSEGWIYGNERYPPDSTRYTDLCILRGRWVPDHVMARINYEANASVWS
jgi:hypothetical protein